MIEAIGYDIQLGVASGIIDRVQVTIQMPMIAIVPVLFTEWRCWRWTSRLCRQIGQQFWRFTRDFINGVKDFFDYFREL